MHTHRKKLLARLGPYWMMEAANVVLVPLFAWIIIEKFFTGKITPAVLASMFAASFLLVIGAFAWKMVVDALKGNSRSEIAWTPWIDIARWPALFFILVALIFISFEATTSPRLTQSIIGSCVLCLLAILEYVNYYHFQLQHFDNWEDFKRLTSGKGFRKSHLAKSIETYRKGVQRDAELNQK